MKILLVCNAGLSTSLVVESMKKAAQKQGESHEIWAIDVGSVNQNIQADVVLLGPQISYLKESVITQLKQSTTPVAIINQMDYGMCDGEKVLQQALSLIERG